MASSINASLTNGLVTTADTSGIINLQSNGATVAAVSSTGVAVTGTLSSTGNTTLGDASTDTLNVGNGDLVKDASGNVGIGVSPTVKLDIAGAVQSTGNNKVKGDSSALIARNTAGTGGGQISVVNAWNANADVTSLAIGAITNLKFFTNNSVTESMTLNTSGGCQHLNTIGVGNATPSTSGAGITFPATQSASTDANTLDDYEEGTWTPTIIGLTTAGTGTYISQNGTYTKIGRLVTVCLTMQWSAHTGTGNMAITNLPFTAGSGSLEYTTVPEFTNMTMPASTIPYAYISATSSNIINLGSIAVGTGLYAGLAMDTSAIIGFSLTYTV